MTLYKTMNGINGAYGNGDYTGCLPKGKRPGKWLPKVKPVLCESGYHYCEDPLDLLEHYGPDLYEVEVRGEVVTGSDKSAAEQMRLVRRVPAWSDSMLRYFAIDCARRVAYLVPDDEREFYGDLLDLLTGFAEFDAAWDAARGAAWDAAWGAAWDAAWDAARDAARGAAWDAARGAARGAAWDAARGAAWDAQRELFCRYLDGEQGPLVEREP